MIGFLVDAGLLLTAIACGAGPLNARVLSIAIAAFVTWRLNRRYTFGDSGLSQRQEGLRYLAGVALGSSANYGLYAVLVAAMIHPFAALSAASALVMGFSYFYYRMVVFSGPKPL